MLQRQGGCDVLVILYALSAVYFAGVMVRLMLTLTPVVCILAAVAFSKVFSIYLRDDTRQSDVTDDADDDKEKNDKYYDKVRSVCLESSPVPRNLAFNTWDGSMPLPCFQFFSVAGRFINVFLRSAIRQWS